MSAFAEIILIARIGVSVKRSDLLRILVNVAGKMEEIVFVIDVCGLEFSLKQAADAVIFFIEVANIGVGNPAHELCNSVLALLFEDEVKMIRHEAVAKQGDFFFFKSSSPVWCMSDWLVG